MRLAAAMGALALLAGCNTTADPVPPVAAAEAPPHPNSINGQLSRPWHHVRGPVSAQRKAEDEAKCKVVASMTGPSDSDIQYWVTYINCLKAAGYQPDPPK